MVVGKYVKLYTYNLSREGLILENEGRWGEIAPLPGFSRETLPEALEEVKKLWPDLSAAKLPSVRFGWTCLQKPLQSVRVPLAAFKQPKQGFTTLKLKLGTLSVADALPLVSEHKQHYRLRLDFNRCWTLEQALEFARYFKPTDFEYLEEPVNNFEDLVTFSEMTRFPIALDESIRFNWNAIPSLKAVVVKPTVIGEIPKVPEHIDLILSSSYETGLGLVHIALLANSNKAVGLDTVQTPDLLTNPIDCSAGYFTWTNTNDPIDTSKLCAVL